MTLLATKVGLEEAFWTLRMALAGSQLPASRAGYTLISSGPRARLTRQVTLGALTSVAVITKTKTILVKYKSIKLFY